MSATAEAIEELRALDAAGDHEALVDGLREAVAADRRAFADPWVKGWCGRRWRNLFVTEAARDEAAVAAASQRVGIPGTGLSVRTGRDRRPERQRIAERFLHGPPEEWREELPPPPAGEPDATLVICPGLVNSMLPWRAFQAALPKLAAERGWPVLCADAHPVRSCAANVEDLAAAIERGEGLDHGCARIAPEAAEPPGDVVLLGYSKGSPDALTALVDRPGLAERVRALYGWGGAFGGSFLADDIYDAIKDADIPLGRIGDTLAAVLKAVCPLVNLEGLSERLDEYDVKGAIRDLTTTERERFLAEHAEELDALNLPIFTITAATTALEVPTLQAQGYLEIRKRDPQNDMQLTQAQARLEIPMATHLAVLRAHHWDISYDPFPLHTRMGSANLDHRFPREAALVAIVQLTAELGLA